MQHHVVDHACRSLSHVATLQGSMKQILALRSLSGWITPTSGVLLVCSGTYGLLSRVIPA